MNILKKTASSLVLAAALAAAGCGGGGSDTAYQTPAPTPAPTPMPTPTPPPTAESYTAWFKSVYPQAADSAPVVMDDLVINFDSNDDPMAFSDLFPPEV